MRVYVPVGPVGQSPFSGRSTVRALNGACPQLEFLCVNLRNLRLNFADDRGGTEAILDSMQHGTGGLRKRAETGTGGNGDTHRKPVQEQTATNFLDEWSLVFALGFSPQPEPRFHLNRGSELHMPPRPCFPLQFLKNSDLPRRPSPEIIRNRWWFLAVNLHLSNERQKVRR